MAKNAQISEALQKILDSITTDFDAPESEKISDNSYEHKNRQDNMRKNYQFLKDVAEDEEIANGEKEEVNIRGQVAGHGYSNKKSKKDYGFISSEGFDPTMYYTKYEVYSKAEIDSKNYATTMYVNQTVNEIAGDVQMLKDTFLAFKSMFDLMKEIEKVEEGDTPSITEFYPDSGLGSSKLLVEKKTGKEVWLKPYSHLDASDKLTLSTNCEIDIGLNLKVRVIPEGRLSLFQVGLNKTHMSEDNSTIIQIALDYAVSHNVMLSFAGVNTKASRIQMRDKCNIDGESTGVITAANKRWPIFWEGRGGTGSGTTVSNMMTIKNLTLYGTLQSNEILAENGINGGPQNSGPKKTVAPSPNEYEVGIYLRCAGNSKIQNVMFYRFRSAGLVLRGKATGMVGSTIDSCIFEECHIGLHMATRTEYNQVINSRCNFCNYGVLNRGGNNTYIMTSANMCAFGFVLASGSNDGHGNMTNGQLNHNMYSVVAYYQDSGFVFIGMQMFYGDVFIKDCKGVVFNMSLFKANRSIIDSDLKNSSTPVGYNQYSSIMMEPYGQNWFSRTQNAPAGLINVINQLDGSSVNWASVNNSWYTDALKNYVYGPYVTNGGSGSTYTDTACASTIFNHGMQKPIYSDYKNSIEFKFAQNLNNYSNVPGILFEPLDYDTKEATYTEKGLLITHPWRLSQEVKLHRLWTHEISATFEMISNLTANIGLCSWNISDTSKYRFGFYLSQNNGVRLQAIIGSTTKTYNIPSDQQYPPGQLVTVKYRYEPTGDGQNAILYAFINDSMIGAGQEIPIPSGDLSIDSFSNSNALANCYLSSISISSEAPKE
ncbi:MAG: hypothetical protein ACRCZ9_05700 [Fusobacteriaceae bacterium]